MPIAAISIVGFGEQWFRASVGTVGTTTARETSFCTHAMLGSQPMVVLDTLFDPRFVNNPLVTGDPWVRFYAGAPIKVDSLPFGALCVIDVCPCPMVADGLLELLSRLADAIGARIREDASPQHFYTLDLNHPP